MNNDERTSWRSSLLRRATHAELIDEPPAIPDKGAKIKNRVASERSPIVTEGAGIASDVVKVKGEDPATPGPLT